MYRWWSWEKYLEICYIRSFYKASKIRLGETFTSSLHLVNRICTPTDPYTVIHITKYMPMPSHAVTASSVYDDPETISSLS